MTILVTGGTGYIGSHTVVQLLEAGHEVLVLNNVCNSKAQVIDRITKIAGKAPGFIEGDARGYLALAKPKPQRLWPIISPTPWTFSQPTLIPRAWLRWFAI